MMADSCVARKCASQRLIVEGALNIDSVAGQLGFVVLQDLTVLTPVTLLTPVTPVAANQPYLPA